MKFGVLVFPGSNCDHDTHHVVDAIAHQPVTYLWHASEDLQGCDAILVPGGFAYGDYLRTGAIAKFAPVMQSVAKFAKGGGLVLGIIGVLWLEMRDKSIRTEQDVTAALDLPMLVSVPWIGTDAGDRSSDGRLHLRPRSGSRVNKEIVEV